MTCPECGTKIGVIRRKFSNTAYCSEACRQTARQKQNQSSLDLLLSNKKRHLAHSQPAPALPATVERPPEPERAREAVHSGVLVGFAAFQRPGARRAPVGTALLAEDPAAVETGTRWQDAVLCAVRPGLGITGWAATAMNTAQPLAAAPLDSTLPAETDWGATWQDAPLHGTRPGVGLAGRVATAMSCLQPLPAVLFDSTAPAETDCGPLWQDAHLHAVRPGLGVTGWVATAKHCLQPLAATPLDSTAPAETDWGARWQDALLHGIRPGLGLTGWIVTAMSCLPPLAATLPAPGGEPGFAPATTLSRACDTLRPVWEQPSAEPERGPETEAPGARSRWIARPPAPARLADQWLGLSAASEFVSPVDWPQFRQIPQRDGFALFAACKAALASKRAASHPSAVADAPLAFELSPVTCHSPLTARAARLSRAAFCEERHSRRQAELSARQEPPGREADAPVRWVRLESGVRAPNLGKLSPAAWTKVQRFAMPASAVVKTNSEPMRWRYDVRRSSHEPLIARPPDWKLLVPPVVEDAPPVAIEPAAEVKVEAVVEPPALPEQLPLSVKDRLAGLREKLLAFPQWTRRLGFHMAWFLPLTLAAVWFGPAIKASSSGGISAQWSEVKAAIRRRATIDLEDDFRGGLNHWNGAGGWAKSWSYDATGLLHPGALSLYVESAGLVDYSVEFLGVIEKRALGWTYRTADMRNYYATRLAITRRGNIPTLDLERYAVIDGRQDRRVQLPLPVVLSNITSFRVRTEVQGSRFTTYLNGKIIDAWSDERLLRGGIGFFAEPDAVVGLNWVRVIQGDDLIGRLCAQVSSAFGR